MEGDERQPLLGIRTNPRWVRGSEAAFGSNQPLNESRRSAYLLPRTISRDVLPQDSHNIQGVKVITPPTGWRLRLAVTFILLSVVFERISFYGLTGNLVLFLNMRPFQWEYYDAMSAMLLFFAITYIMSLVGGWIADSFLGRFKFMLLAFVIYAVGYTLLPFVSLFTDLSSNSTALPKICLDVAHSENSSNLFKENCAWLIFIILLIIGVGAGSLKSAICPFGSEQLACSSQQIQMSFFNWFYWCVNFGSFIGLGALTYIQQQKAFYLGYIVGAATLGVSGILFTLGRCFYVCRPPDGSVLTNIYRIIKEAWQKRRTRHSQKSASNSALGYIESSHEEKISFLDHAKLRHGGSFHNSLVDDVKKLNLVLVVFAVLIPYWIVYFQMQTSFLFQGLSMKLGYGNVSKPGCNHTNATTGPPSSQEQISTLYPKIVAAWFTLFDACFVILLLPLFDRVIYPRMAKAGYPFTFTNRIVLGMVFAMLAMIVAAVVEHFRLQSFWPYAECPCVNASIKQIIGDTTYEAADMSVFYQIPQYALLGISEVFASVASLQFAVLVAPKSMKAIITGLYYFFSGLGSLLGTAIISILSSSEIWIYGFNYGNINCRIGCEDPGSNKYSKGCHLDYFFYLLAGIELLAIFLFLVVSKKFGFNVEQLTIGVHSRSDVSSGEKKT